MANADIATTTTTPAYRVGFVDHRFIANDVAVDNRPEVTSPEAAFEVVSDLEWPIDREACYRLDLDTKHRLLGVELVSIGSVDHTFMAPREVYRGALLAGSSAIVLAHNHPSGDPTPSRDDELLTKRLARGGEMIGVELLDALVLGSNDRWVSLARRGVM